MAGNLLALAITN